MPTTNTIAIIIIGSFLLECSEHIMEAGMPLAIQCCADIKTDYLATSKFIFPLGFIVSASLLCGHFEVNQAGSQ
jgi:hypothetical protein